MDRVFFRITTSHRARFGGRSTAALRADAMRTTGPARLWLLELAGELDHAELATLDDAPEGWGWTAVIAAEAEQPSSIWRKKHGHRPPGMLRVLRDATAAAMTDAAAARIADLGDALERDGFEYLDDAPTDWYWVPGGRA